MNKYVILDTDTGEIVEEGFKIITQKQTQNFHKMQKKKITTKDFYFLKYKNNCILDSRLQGSNLTRLIYLSTYCDYDNYLVLDNGVYMGINDIKDVLKICDTQFQIFLKECKKKFLLEFENDKIKISDEHIFRGKLKKKYLLEYNMTRMYSKAIRYLYNNCDARSHKILSYLFVLIPYCNVQYNIICSNPGEEELSEIETLSLTDICDIIGYSRENYHKLKNNLKKIKVKNKNVVAFVESDARESIIINPDLYYAGNCYGEVRVLGKFY